MSDDLRVRVARDIFDYSELDWHYIGIEARQRALRRADHAIAIVWNEAHRAGYNEAIEAAAKVARNACLVPPDGGSPTQEERELCDHAEAGIRALRKPEVGG